MAAGQPGFGLFGNTFTFLAIAFERYIVSATRRLNPASPAPPSPAKPNLRSPGGPARPCSPSPRQGDDRASTRPEETYASANAAYDELFEVKTSNSTWPTSPASRRRSRRCSRWSSTTATAYSRAATNASAHCSYGTSSRRSSTAVRPRDPPHVTPDRSYRVRKAPKVFDHVAKIYKLVLLGSSSTFH